MRFVYPAKLDHYSENEVVVSFWDVPWCHTSGQDVAEALAEAEDALEEAIAGCINHGEPIPMPSAPLPGEHMVALPIDMAAKAFDEVMRVTTKGECKGTMEEKEWYALFQRLGITTDDKPNGNMMRYRDRLLGLYWNRNTGRQIYFAARRSDTDKYPNNLWDDNTGKVKTKEDNKWFPAMPKLGHEEEAFTDLLNRFSGGSKLQVRVYQRKRSTEIAPFLNYQRMRHVVSFKVTLDSQSFMLAGEFAYPIDKDAPLSHDQGARGVWGKLMAELDHLVRVQEEVEPNWDPIGTDADGEGWPIGWEKQ